MPDQPIWKPRWHQRIPIVRTVREGFRSALFDALRAVARTEDARWIGRTMLDDSSGWRPVRPPASAIGMDMPYDLGRASQAPVNGRPRPIFITARFRSGSTLLWNLFRHVDGCTSYYEPLNERRWFDPAHRGARVDGSHRGVDNYWREYEGLEELGRYYREDWIRRRLYMDEGAWDPDLAAYVRTLVDRAPARPVLQFNRIDFRLAWFRHTFPDAFILHLHRNPRSQWCSSFIGGHSCPPGATMREFAENDGFYLQTWANDLKYWFPFLEPSTIGHPYRLFYLIWKLSFWWGVTYSDYSLSYDALVARPEWELRRLFQSIPIAGQADWSRLVSLVEPVTPRWAAYAADEWFRDHEAACDRVLLDFFAPGGAVRPVATPAPGDASTRTDHRAAAVTR